MKQQKIINKSEENVIIYLEKYSQKVIYSREVNLRARELISKLHKLLKDKQYINEKST